MDTQGYEIILASGSPRRQAYFKEMGIPFRVQTHAVDESYPKHLKGEAIAIHIVQSKAAPFKAGLQPKQLVVTADTIVWHNQKGLGKPKNETEAFDMLQALSGSEHEVITAVGFLQKERWECIHATTKVQFKPLTHDEIQTYIQSGNCYDKAGGYGIQDWIGIIGIDHIVGSYTNVVGLPVAAVYDKIYHILNR